MAPKCNELRAVPLGSDPHQLGRPVVRQALRHSHQSDRLEHQPPCIAEVGPVVFSADRVELRARPISGYTNRQPIFQSHVDSRPIQPVQIIEEQIKVMGLGVNVEW